MAIKISGPYKGFFITAEAIPSIPSKSRRDDFEFVAHAYIYVHAPTGDGRGTRLNTDSGVRFARISDALAHAEQLARLRIDELADRQSA